MPSLPRLLLLGRLARRNAARHRAQTARAILGLLVTTIILTVGLGLGESVTASLEASTTARFGPIDVALRSQQPFEEDLAGNVLDRAGVGEAVQGAASLELSGAAHHAAKGLAEPSASIRGVAPKETQALGPMKSTGGRAAAPEISPGEVALTAPLARSIDARVGDTITLRAQKLGAQPDPSARLSNSTGVAGVPGREVEAHAFAVASDAAGVLAEVRAEPAVAPLRAVLRSPTGIEYANESSTSPVSVLVPGPVTPGQWSLLVSASIPIGYTASYGPTYIATDDAGGMAAFDAHVVAIVEPEGRAGIAGARAALVPLSDLQRALGADGKANVAYYAVEGEAVAVARAMQAALPESARGGITVRAERASALEDARSEGSGVGAIVIMMGGFTLVASVLLTFTLFSSLVEERRAEIGISRALGLTRGEVALMMTLEGALYSFAAALIGVLVGTLGLWLAVTFAGEALVTQVEGEVSLAFQLSPATLGGAFVGGALFPLATIAIFTRRLLRFDPARAIRGIPDDPDLKRRRGFLGASALVGIGALLSLAPHAHVIGIPIALCGASLLLKAVGRARVALAPLAAALAYMAYTLYASSTGDGVLDAMLSFATAGVLALTLAALAVSSKAPYDALLRAISRRRGVSMSGFIGMRYLFAHRRPVAATMAMVSLVIVVMTVLGMIFTVAATEGDSTAGGYHVVATAPAYFDQLPAPLPEDVEALVERVDIAPHYTEPRYGDDFVGVTDELGASFDYRLRHRAAQYESDRAAWLAVARGEAIIVPWVLVDEPTEEIGAMESVSTSAFGPIDLVVAGAYEGEPLRWRTFVAAEHVRDMGFPQRTIAFVRVAEGADATFVAHRLSAHYAHQGIGFTSVPAEVAREEAEGRGLGLMVGAFLGLGLLIGIAGTGFLASRAVRSRIREIGTMRAIGLEPSHVKRAFVIESVTTVAGGVLIGAFSGLLAAHSLWWRLIRDSMPFSPPWALLAAVCACVLVLAVLVTRGAADAAARLPPSQAVRHVE